jgi:hypothetical protein
MMKKISMLAILVLMLAACSPAAARQGASPAGSTAGGVENSPSAGAADGQISGASNLSAQGPQGIRDVQVSDGIILLTPGQPLPTPDLGPLGGETTGGGTADAQATAAPTVDPASVKLPDGVPLYPGATVAELSPAEDPSGMGIQYVIFYTADSFDQVSVFYSQKVEPAGWAPLTLEATPDANGMRSLVWSKGQVFLTVQAWPPVEGKIKVQISWMKL